MSYYKTIFNKLIEAGAPRSFIRQELINLMAYYSEVYIFYNPENTEENNGWYATNAICIQESKTPIKYYGEVKNLGFPNWEEYSVLFEGDEYDTPNSFYYAHEQHMEEWWEEKTAASKIDYSN